MDLNKVLAFIMALRNSANELAEGLEDGLKTAKRELTAVTSRRGIQSLPDEIMERIIWFAYGPRDKAWRNLLFVNRYFRDATCRASFLWTEVDARRDPRLYLERSKSRGLSVSVRKVYSRHVRFEDWLSAIVQDVLWCRLSRAR